MMGVCDGHGVVGHLVSNYVKVNLPKILSNLILQKSDEKKTKSFLPQINGKVNAYDVTTNDTEEEKKPNLEDWLSNNNHRIRDSQIKEAFIQTEKRMEHRSRIDANLSGTTCVMTFFNHDMIVCANSGDSRAILISEQEKNGSANGHYYFTQLSRDHKPDVPDEA